jgi:hypothetical protein
LARTFSERDCHLLCADDVNDDGDATYDDQKNFKELSENNELRRKTENTSAAVRRWELSATASARPLAF